jgi:hypothetical protein
MAAGQPPSEVVMFGSLDDGEKWTEVHRCTDNSDLKGKSLIGT